MQMKTNSGEKLETLWKLQSKNVKWLIIDHYSKEWKFISKQYGNVGSMFQQRKEDNEVTGSMYRCIYNLSYI